MAEAEDIPPFDPFILAGEYVLGVLEGEELADARRAILADSNFVEAVEWWEFRLGAMGEAAGNFVPSPGVWRGIEARIQAEEAANDDTPTPMVPKRLSQSSMAALFGGAALAIAGLVFFVATPRTTVVPDQPPVVAVPGDQLIAQLQDEESGRKLAGRIDVDNNRLALNISGLEAEAGQTPELWVIPAGGAPVSLGAIPETGNFDREIDAAEARLLVAGSTLAVTFEDDTGVRHETPTMPILLAGTLDQV